MAQVRVILRNDVASLGEAGEVVSVKPGYARNYLVPNGLATLATESNVKELEHHRRAISEKTDKLVKELKAEKKAVEKIKLSVEAQAGEEGKLFGSVTTANIADLLAEQGVTVDRRKIDLKDPIKTVGAHKIPIKLHREITAEVVLTVTAAGAPPVDPDDVPEEEERVPNAMDEAYDD
jgi:large subunit ribosomal protein L9